MYPCARGFGSFVMMMPSYGSVHPRVYVRDMFQCAYNCVASTVSLVRKVPDMTRTCPWDSLIFC